MQTAIKLPSHETGQFWEIPVLYEDDHLLALNKPGGLAGSPERHDPDRPNLISLLQRGIKEGKPWARQRDLAYLALAHRLDAADSGVLLLARSKAMLTALANQFGAGKPLLYLLALAQGSPAWEALEVDAKLAPDVGRPGRMRVDLQRGKRSSTRFRVLERFAGWTLLQCSPLTHRRHQVRVHLRRAGFPIAGDGLYGGKPLLLSRLKRDYRLKPNRSERPLLAHATLHAEKVAITHPVTGRMLEIRAPIPKDLSVALKYLRKFATLPGSIAPTAGEGSPSRAELGQ